MTDPTPASPSGSKQVRRACSICGRKVEDRGEFRFYKAHVTCTVMRERGLTFTDGTVPW